MNTMTRLVFSEPSVIAYRYVSLRFSARIRISAKEVVECRRKSARFPIAAGHSSAAKIRAALTSLIPTDRDLQNTKKDFIRPLRKKGLALRKDDALVTTSENR